MKRWDVKINENPDGCLQMIIGIILLIIFAVSVPYILEWLNG